MEVSWDTPARESGAPSPEPSNRAGGSSLANLSSDSGRFNLERSKHILFLQIEDTASPRFKAFFKSVQMDRLLHTLILYFVSFFQLYTLQRLNKGTAEEHRALQQEKGMLLKELSPVYAGIVLNESDYLHTVQDTQFFEALYETTTELLLQAFPGSKRQALVVEELGRVFRTNMFNTAFNARRNAAHISQSPLTIRQLYALKFDDHPALNSRKLSQLYQKRFTEGSVSDAAVSNTPLVNTIMKPDVRHASGAASRMPWHGGARKQKAAAAATAAASSTRRSAAQQAFVEWRRSAPTAQPMRTEKEGISLQQRALFDAGLHRSLAAEP